MQSSQTLNENYSQIEQYPDVREVDVLAACIADNNARFLYQEGMEAIWEKLCSVSEGQDRVVMSQLWELGKKSVTITPKVFPALAAHGFIVERNIDEQVWWEPYSPYLKDFWRVGIQVSNRHGFQLLPEHVFHTNVQAMCQAHL